MVRVPLSWRALPFPPAPRRRGVLGRLLVRLARQYPVPAPRFRLDVIFGTGRAHVPPRVTAPRPHRSNAFPLVLLPNVGFSPGRLHLFVQIPSFPFDFPLSKIFEIMAILALTLHFLTEIRNPLLLLQGFKGLRPPPTQCEFPRCQIGLFA